MYLQTLPRIDTQICWPPDACSTLTIWTTPSSSGVSSALQVVNEASSKNLGDGFRVPALIRFIGDEQPYLANAHGGPRMFVNMEDHVSRQTGQPNQPFLVSFAA